MKRIRESYQTLDALFSTGARVTYEKGENIIRPEETPQGVFLVVEGYVKSFEITRYGEENLLVIRKPKQVFPILWTMTNERTEVYYQAMSRVVLLRLDRKKYLRQLSKNTAISKEVLDQVLTMYRIHSQRVQNLAYRTAPERIAYRIVILADRFGKKSPNGITIMAPMRRQDIAESVNCSRETASREIAKLQNKKLIETKDGYLTVTDPEGLLKMVGAQETILKRFEKFN